MTAFLMLLRWLHFLFGITWIGLLYYLNFAQTPFFAETEAAVRSGAQQKLLPRVLWWFRWGAMGTVIFGATYLIIWWSREGYGWNTWAIAILTGGTLGIIMWANVWLVIWPKQQVVIANAIATAGGAPANPAAASAGRRAALASRTNVLFSIPMLFFMGAASHYGLFTASNPQLGSVTAWLVICGTIIALIEINALVGTQGMTKKPLDTIPGVIWSGFVLWLILTGIIVLVFRD
jgi:uncharacterized membrane protein